MSMVVKNNMSAVQTLTVLNKNSKALSKSLEKVSTGWKIVGAKDGASEYAITERMLDRVRALDQANANTQNGSALLKTAEGALSSTIDILKTLKEKAINAANDTNTETDRTTIQKEIDQLIDQIDENANVTYNGKYLLDGTKNFQGVATKSVYINMNLATDTTDATAFSDLKDRAGHRIDIQADDQILTYVMQARGGTVIHSVTGADAVSSLEVSSGYFPETEPASMKTIVGTNYAGNNVYTPDEKNALVLETKDTGIDTQITSVTIRVLDSEGKIKNNATEMLNNFFEAIQAQDASEDNALTIHTGAKSNETVKIGIRDMRSKALGLKNAVGINISVKTQNIAETVIATIDTALSRALNQQADIGAVQSRFEHTSSTLSIESENVQNAESVFRDADMAKEMTEYTKNNVLMQAAQSMLAQSNQNASAVLSLLQ